MSPKQDIALRGLEVLVVAQASSRSRQLCWELNADGSGLHPRPVADLEQAARLVAQEPGAVVLWCLDRLEPDSLAGVRAFAHQCPEAVLVVAAAEGGEGGEGGEGSDGGEKYLAERLVLAGAQDCLVGNPGAGDLARALRLAAARQRATARLRQEDQRYRAIVCCQRELICRFQPSGRITFMNPAFGFYFALAPEGADQADFYEQVVEQDRAVLMAQLEVLEPDHPLTRLDLRVVPGVEGRERWLRWSIHAIYDSAGTLREYQAVGLDITEGKHLEEALQVAEASLRQLILSNADGMVVTDSQGTVLFVNPAAERILGRTSYELLGRSFEFPLTPGQRQELEVEVGEGERIVAEMQVVETKWRREKAFLATLRDISELKDLQEELRELSLVDPLTGVYNRRGFSTLARQQFKTAQRMGRRMYLFFMDLDELKHINDTLGHSQGDRAIREAASVLKATFRESDILGRWGGDEFVALAMETDEEGSRAVLKRLRQNLEDWNTDTSRPYKLSLSVGTAEFNPDRPTTLEDLLAQADARMYEYKRARPARGRDTQPTPLRQRG